MPYEQITQLPDNVQQILPKPAQAIYKEAFNNAWIEYKDRTNRRAASDREEMAHRVAWAAVKHKYAKGAGGKWYPRP